MGSQIIAWSSLFKGSSLDHHTWCVPSWRLLTCIPSAEPKKAQNPSLASQSCSLPFSGWIVTQQGWVLPVFWLDSPALHSLCVAAVVSGAKLFPRCLGNILTVCLHPKKQTPSARQAGNLVKGPYSYILFGAALGNTGRCQKPWQESGRVIPAWSDALVRPPVPIPTAHSSLWVHIITIYIKPTWYRCPQNLGPPPALLRRKSLKFVSPPASPNARVKWPSQDLGLWLQPERIRDGMGTLTSRTNLGFF